MDFEVSRTEATVLCRFRAYLQRKQLDLYLRLFTVFIGMFCLDWSKRPESSEIACDVDDLREQDSSGFSKFVVVHGACSFGHFQASRSCVHKGGLEKPIVKAGFVATRIYVTNLNLEIVRALAREGIPTISMYPFSCGWSTSNRDVASADLSTVAKTLESGFVPTDVFGVYDRPPSEPDDVLLKEIERCSDILGKMGTTGGKRKMVKR